MTAHELIGQNNHIYKNFKYCIFPENGKFIILTDCAISIEKIPDTVNQYYFRNVYSDKTFLLDGEGLDDIFMGDDFNEVKKEFMLKIDQGTLISRIELSKINLILSSKTLKAFQKKYGDYSLIPGIINITKLPVKNIKKDDVVFVVVDDDIEKRVITKVDDAFIQWDGNYGGILNLNSLEFGLTKEEAVKNYNIKLQSNINKFSFMLTKVQDLYNNYVPSIQTILEFERELKANN